MNPGSWTDLLSAAIAAVAIGLAVWQIRQTLRGVERQLHVQTFVEYTGRFDRVFEKLGNLIGHDGMTARLDSIDGERRGQVLTAMRQYFDLCSQEHFLHNRGALDSETWALWDGQMTETMARPLCEDAWRLLRSQYSTSRAFVAFMDSKLA